MAAPQGNQNAKKGKDWEAALRHALNHYEGGQVARGQALRQIATRVVEKAIEGDQAAIQEIGNRLDGKPTQAISGEDGGPLTVEIVRLADTTAGE